MSIPQGFAKICYQNWYRGMRIARKEGKSYDTWRRFWERRLQALEKFYKH